jgi:hypothetical protein
MEIRYDQRRGKAVVLAKAQSFDAAIKPLGNEVDGADGVRRALG